MNGFTQLQLFNAVEFDPRGYASNSKYFCMDDQFKHEWTNLSIAIAVIFGILAVLILLGTLTDILLNLIMFGEAKSKQNDGFWTKVFCSFSLYSNWKAVMSTHAGGQDTLTCLHGMRFISMTWVVLGHSFIFTSVYSNVKNPILLGEIFAGKLGLAFEAVLIATPSVDSFFLLRNVLDILIYF